MVPERDLRVTPAAGFKAQTYKVVLPSARVVAVREIDLLALLANEEDIPDFFSGQLMAKLTNQPPPDRTVTIRETHQFMSVVIRAAVVQPVVVETGADYESGQINLGDLTMDDKLHVFGLVMPSEVGVARSFRQRVEEANMVAVPDGDGDGDEAERDPGDDE